MSFGQDNSSPGSQFDRPPAATLNIADQYAESLRRPSSVYELSSAFTKVIYHAFGPGTALDLANIFRAWHVQEFDSLRFFFTPSAGGLLFEKLQHLIGEPNLRFDILFRDFPIAYQNKLAAGRTCDFVRSRINAISQSLTVGAFEYFLLYFAFHPLYVHDRGNSLLQFERYQSLYSLLVDEYLNVFLPNIETPDFIPRRNWFNSFNSSESFGSSDFGQRSVGFTSSGGSQSPKQLSTPLNLFRKELYAQSDMTTVQTPSRTDESRMNGQYPDAVSRAQLILQILTDVWFTVPQSGLPSTVQVVVVRQLIKHIHRFSYGCPSVMRNVQDHGQNVLSRFSQHELYMFFKHCFLRWPVDSSFRFVLETWLSYIQPWRYCTPQGKELRVVPRQDWEAFICANFGFFYTFVHLLLERLLRMDYFSVRSASMVVRVTKILSLENLLAMLQNVEAAIAHNRPISGEKLQLAEASFKLHEPHFSSGGYQPMFESMGWRQWSQLVHQLQLAQFACIQQKQALIPRPHKRSWLTWMKSFLTEGSESAIMEHELSRTCELLDFAILTLSALLRIPLREIDESVVDTLAPECKGSPGKLGEPDTVVGNNGQVRLSPVGQYQVINNLRRFRLAETISSFPEDLWPPRAGECTILIRWLQAAADWLNSRLGTAYLQDLYHDRTIKGRLARRTFLLAPSHLQTSCKPVVNRELPDLPARFCFRRFATYKTLLFVLCLVTFSMIFGISSWLVMPFILYLLLQLNVLLVFGD